MDELSEYSSPVIEFKATHTADKRAKLLDNSTATDPQPAKVHAASGTQERCSQATQTDQYSLPAAAVDERQLATWLRKVWPAIEKELLSGCTPLVEAYGAGASREEHHIQPYQKITVPAADNSQCLATWLAVQTNNAPTLVVTTVSPHDDWCEHVDQALLLYAPYKEANSSFVSYTEVKRVPLKACLRSLCTNPFNKNIFAGSTLDGDVYVWCYEHNVHSGAEVKELYTVTLPQGCAVAMDWSSEHTLVTAHSNGHVVQWHLGQELLMEAAFIIKHPSQAVSEICCLLVLSAHNFVVGCKDGAIFHCWISSANAMKRNLEVIALKRHLFMTSSLLRVKRNGHPMVISCDLSGVMYFHDLRSSDDETDTVIAQIPLPFTNAIACNGDGSIIYSPGADGSLECYRVRSGDHFSIGGAIIRGSGNFIKSSDNGCWIVTGLYDNDLQLFAVDY